MIFQQFDALIEKGEVPGSVKPEHRNIASRRCTNKKHMGLVVWMVSQAWWVDVLHENFDRVGSVQTSNLGNAMRGSV
jgi:hypothetical protein